MHRVTEDEKEQLTSRRKDVAEDYPDTNSQGSIKKKKKKTKKRKGRRHKREDEDEEEYEKETVQESKKKSSLNNDMFIIGTYNLIKMLGFGTFGEIHLAYDTSTRQLRAIKFEIATQKNPQLKHEFNILEQLNKIENGILSEGIPKVFGFDMIENKCNYMIMDFLGPSLSDLFQFKNKQFSLKTVCLIAIQMLQRIEYIHEKGFIHRDIKPENFVIGLNEKSNIVYTIDFGLSKRYKDKNTGQHIPYRENRHLVGTARYASLNSHLGVEQSRRDDIESIGYVLVYFLLGRLPWQSQNEKGKLPTKIIEKKLITPPEILCKKLPMEFAYYFHYCKNLKFEDRPDYATLKYLFYDLLMKQDNISTHYPEFTFDWYQDEKEEDVRISLMILDKETPGNPNNRRNNDLHHNIITDNPEASTELTPGYQVEDTNFINFNDINSNINITPNDKVVSGLTGRNKNSESFSFNTKNEFINDDINPINLNVNEHVHADLIQLKNIPKKDKNLNHDESWSERSSGQDTEREIQRNDDEDIKKIIKAASDSNKDNSDSHYKLLSSSGKSSEDVRKQTVNQHKDEEIILKPKKNIKGNRDVVLNIPK